MQTAVALHDAVVNVTANGIGTLQPECIKLKEKLMLDGPVLPLVGAIPFWIVGKKPVLAAMQPVLALLVFFHSISSLLMFYLGKRLTSSKNFGLVAGLLWATYPSAVLGTTKLLTEPVAAMLSLLALLLCVLTEKSAETTGKRFFSQTFSLGIILSLLVLLRPILAPALVLIFLGLMFALKKRGKSNATIGKGISSFVVGAALIMSPWLIYTYASSGSISITPKRAPVYNLICGFDLDSDGRIFVTKSITKIDEEKDSSIQMLTNNIQAKPIEHLLLTLRKPSRIWGEAWNDYRASYLFLPAPAVNWWHLLLVASGIAGIISFFASFLRKSEQKDIDEIVILSGSFCFIAVHFLYIFFSACPRYGHTSMPFVCLFGVYFLSRLIKHKQLLKSSIFCVVSLLITFLIVITLPIQEILLGSGLSATACLLFSVLLKASYFLTFSVSAILSTHPECKTYIKSIKFKTAVTLFAGTVILISTAEEMGSPLEYKQTLEPKQKIGRDIELNVIKKPDWVLLLVDGSKEIENCRAYINGHSIDGSFIPLNRFSTDDNSLHNYQMFSKLLNVDQGDFRQWRAISVPAQFLNLDGKNEIEIEGDKERAQVYGSYNQPLVGTRLPSLFNFCFYKLNTKSTDLDARVPYVTLNSDKHTGTDLKKLTRLVLALGHKSDQYNISADVPFTQTRNLLAGKSIPIPILPGRLTFIDTGVNDLKIKTNGLLKVTLDSTVTASAPTKLMIDLMCRLENQPDYSVNVFDKTKLIELSDSGKDESFSYVSYIPASAVSVGNFRPQAVIVANKAAVQLKSLNAKIERIDAPDFRNTKVELY